MRNLTQQIKSIEYLPEILSRYCESDRPFEAPFYWAGFICQGMA
jgi:CHAT domain-containing protein